MEKFIPIEKLGVTNSGTHSAAANTLISSELLYSEHSPFLGMEGVFFALSTASLRAYLQRLVNRVDSFTKIWSHSSKLIVYLRSGQVTLAVLSKSVCGSSSQIQDALLREIVLHPRNHASSITTRLLKICNVHAENSTHLLTTIQCQATSSLVRLVVSEPVTQLKSIFGNFSRSSKHLAKAAKKAADSFSIFAQVVSTLDLSAKN